MLFLKASFDKFLVQLKEYLLLIKILWLFIVTFNLSNVEKLTFLFFQIRGYQIYRRFQSRRRILEHGISYFIEQNTGFEES